MQFAWSEIIERAKVYIDDDHDEEGGWIDDDVWLKLTQVEYGQLYKRWIRASVIAPATTDTSFTGPSTALTGVLAIIGVAEDLGDGQYRVLSASQPEFGRNPIRSTSDSPAVCWSANGTGDNLTITLYPADTQRTYFVRYLTVPARATSVAATVELPFGSDERLVLGTARRTKLKDSSTSSLLNGLIFDADAELAFTGAGRNNGDGLRIITGRSTPRSGFSASPLYWRFY